MCAAGQPYFQGLTTIDAEQPGKGIHQGRVFIRNERVILRRNETNEVANDAYIVGGDANMPFRCGTPPATVCLMIHSSKPVSLPRERWLQLLILTAFLVMVGLRAFRLKLSVLDLDIWWHLKTGDWIVDHAAVPHSGLFTWTAADHPWIAYSWGYEVLLSRAYAWFGLIGIGAYGTLLTLGVACFVYWMLRRLSGRFWPAFVLTLFTCSAFLFNLMPRPVFFSMILFCVTLTFLLEANRTGRVRLLYYLPLVFLLWANLHIQFIYALFAVGLLAAVTVIQPLVESREWARAWLQPNRLPPATLAAVFGACLITTCVGPYTFHLYPVILSYAHAKAPYRIIMELQPLSFRAGSHYAELLLMVSAFFAVGRQKKVDIFKVLLLSVAGVVAFRAMRDAWFICIPASACIADSFTEACQPESRQPWWQTAAVLAGTATLLLLLAPSMDFTNRGLDHAVSGYFPVNAVNYLRTNPTPGPLYNSLDWGGFLIWYMPEQLVAIDGRTDLYGDDMDMRFFNTINGLQSPADDPYLNQARTLVLQRINPLANWLQTNPDFQLAYQDDLAVVYVRR